MLKTMVPPKREEDSYSHARRELDGDERKEIRTMMAEWRRYKAVLAFLRWVAILVSGMYVMRDGVVKALRSILGP